MKKLLFAVGVLGLAGAVGLPISARAGVAARQSVTLQAGWNAFYLTVSPDVAASTFFADWPVAEVSAYDPAAFLETREYSGTSSTEGTSAPGYLTWRRGDVGVSSLTGVAGNMVYLAYNTNTTAFTREVYGTPVAPYNTWHISSTNEPMNMIGIACGTAGTTISDYFDGLTTGNTSYYTYKLWGSAKAEPKLMALFPTTALKNGDVVVMSATKLSDWSGVFKVTPMNGIDFSTNLDTAVVAIRNESTKTRRVRLGVGAGSAANVADLPPVPTGLLCQTKGGSWVTFSPDYPFEAEIATNETLEVSLALDRTQLLGGAGTSYGALLAVSDESVSDGSHFQTFLPLTATSDGGAASEYAWPKGVWLASVTLDEVMFMETSTATTNRLMQTAGGEMKFRLPVYVDAEKRPSLLQRFWYGSATNQLRRVSTPFLPIDTPEIAASSGTFGTTATFPFTIAADSRANPYRHALHPQHGDDSGNLFAISNTVVLTWNETEGTAWRPDETVSGTIQWYFGGLRHEGDIKAAGTFTMKRVLKGKMK